MYQIFLGIGQGVFILWGVENCRLPLTKPVAVNTGLALLLQPVITAAAAAATVCRVVVVALCYL